MAACSALPQLPAMPNFGNAAGLDRVLASSPAERDALWQEFSKDPPSVLAATLLKSLPGHTHYAPYEARHELEQLLASGALSTSERRVLELRLLDLQRELELSTLLHEREQRLKTLIEIEQRLNDRGP